jgi:hypothetical protein
MFIRKLIAVLTLTATPFAPLAAHAATGTSPAESRAAHAPCILGQYRIASVTPYVVQQNLGGRITAQRVLGAEAFVPAEPGLTAEWLWATLARHVGAMKGSATGMKDCALGVDKVQVEVTPAGPGFRVRLVASDPASGKEVLRRVQQLLVS